MHVENQLRLGLFDPGLSAIDSVDLAPLFDLDFTQGRPYAHRIVNKTAATATRASAANRYWLQPADDLATNVLRYAEKSAINRLNGLLIEGADQNVILQNTIYAALNWTVGANLTMTDDTDVDLYDGHSFKAVEGAAGEEYIYQTVALTAVKYIVEALVYTDGSAVSAANCRMAAAASGGIAGLTTTFEHVGGGVYLAWAVFTATAANWDVGVNVRASQTVYFSLLSCYLAATASEGGDFPRSPIPNATGAAVTRAGDVYTHPGTNNIGASEGTIDVQVVSPVAVAASVPSLRMYEYYKDGNNRIFLDYTGANLRFYIRMGGVGTCSVNSAPGRAARNTVCKYRLIWRQASTLDGTNYGILYGDIGAGWTQLKVSAVQPTGALNTTGTIYVGMENTSVNHWGEIIRRLRIFDYVRGVGVPGDF